MAKRKKELSRWNDEVGKTQRNRQQRREQASKRARQHSLSLSLGHPASGASSGGTEGSHPPAPVLFSNIATLNSFCDHSAWAWAVLGLGSLHGWGHFRSSCVISRHRRLCGRQWSAYSRGRQAFLALQSADQSQTTHVHETCTCTVSSWSAVSLVSKMPLSTQPTVALEWSAHADHRLGTVGCPFHCLRRGRPRGYNIVTVHFCFRARQSCPSSCLVF